MNEESSPEPLADGLWFVRKEGGLGFAPVAWPGRAVLYLYALLVVVAVVTYAATSAIGVMVMVVLFYTAVFLGVLVVKSDLFSGRFPPPDRSGDQP